MILANRPLRDLQVITVDTEMPFRIRLLGGFFFNCGVGSRVWRCCRGAVEVATDPRRGAWRGIWNWLSRGIGAGQKRAAFGVGWNRDRSPLKGCCAVTFG